MDGCEGDQVQCGETQGGKEEDLKDTRRQGGSQGSQGGGGSWGRKGRSWQRHWMALVALRSSDDGGDNASAPHFVDNHRRIL